MAESDAGVPLLYGHLLPEKIVGDGSVTGVMF